MTDERRKSVRRSTSATFLLINRQTGELVGRALDISPDGLLIASEQAVEPGTTIPCKLTFPYWHGLHQYVKFRATSRWCQKNLHLDWYESGWSMSELSDVDHRIVEELIAEWETKDNLGTFRIGIPKAD